MDIKEIIAHGLTYAEYRTLVDKLLLEGKTTGSIQNREKLEATQLNVHRMNRLDKTIILPVDKVLQLRMTENPVIWLVVADAWCGDSAQILPVMNKIAEASSGSIELKIVSRDSYPQFTEAYHAMSIPKLLCIDKHSGEVLDTWGPRPKPAQHIAQKWKESLGRITKDEFHKELHLWYSKDKGVAIINELLHVTRERNQRIAS